MISLQDIKSAQKRIAPYIYDCPLIHNVRMSDELGGGIYFKPENLQRTGSFKVRGALSKILTLDDSERKRGIVAASSGNHALGVAYGAALTGTKAVIVMPENALRTKVEGVKSLGAEVIMCGKSADERYEEVGRIMSERGCILVHGCNDPAVMAGQGTIGLEIVKDMPDTDVVVVPLGAGAIAAGIACAVKENNSSIRVIGVETTAVPRFTASLAKGCPVDVPYKPSVADGLMMTRTFPDIFGMINKYVDEVICVEDSHILSATGEIVKKARMIAEPSAAVGIAAVLSGKLKLGKSKKHVFVLTGGNIDTELLCDLLGG